MTSFGPINDLFGAENVTSIWGINPGHFEEAGIYDLYHSHEKCLDKIYSFKVS